MVPEETPMIESLVEYEIEDMEVEVAPQVDAGDAPEDAGDVEDAGVVEGDDETPADAGDDEDAGDVESHDEMA